MFTFLLIICSVFFFYFIRFTVYYSAYNYSVSPLTYNNSSFLLDIVYIAKRLRTAKIYFKTLCSWKF